MVINQLGMFDNKENLVGKVEKPSKIALDIARPFKCVLCGQMASKLDGNMCVDCFCEAIAKDRKVR